MKVKLFWEEIEQESYVCREYGTTLADRFELVRTEPDLDDITLEDLEYVEAPVIANLPNKIMYFNANALDVQKIMNRRPGQPVLGVFIEDFILIINRGFVDKYNVPLDEVEVVRTTTYRHPPRIVQLIGAHVVIGGTWPEEDAEKMRAAFESDKKKLLNMWGFEE